MKRCRFLGMGAAVLVFGFVSLVLPAQEGQDPRVEAYQRNFVQAGMSVKLQVLQDASQEESVNMGPLYQQAVDFLINNSFLLENDTTAGDIAIFAVRLIGDQGYKPARYSVWELFSMYKNTNFRVASMNTLGGIAEGDEKLIQAMNNWLDRRNSIYRTGQTVDQQVVRSCVNNLGELGNPDSFSPIFTTMVLRYSDAVTRAARQALARLDGDYTEHLIQVIKNGSIQERHTALVIGLESEEVSGEDQRGRVAAAALEAALDLDTTQAENYRKLQEMRFTAARVLTELEWSASSDEAVEHLNRTISEYDRGDATLSNLLEAVALLGTMGTKEAAVRLTSYLELLNSYVENGEQYNAQLVLAIIRNLGILGDQAAYNDLLYATYLDYPSSVKKAAREAIDSIQW
ncbi:MAG: hypothetical protein K9L68_00705 [Spirochaetales bacterium]|nr:hypothetical protein [Spirochaetales bacterium]MCF7937096.1 hypothetical protein [Spirochaetales bacterium]